jgi:hypothetical protein
VLERRICGICRAESLFEADKRGVYGCPVCGGGGIRRAPPSAGAAKEWPGAARGWGPVTKALEWESGPRRAGVKT